MKTDNMGEIEMDFIQTYGTIIKKQLRAHPDRAFRLFLTGLSLERFRSKHLANKRLPRAYRYLNTYAVDRILYAFRHPEKSVFCNLFSPVEILQSLGLEALSIECISSFISGFKIEDTFLEYAQEEGLSGTLCSYHKNLIGAMDSGMLPVPGYALTTSTICDSNLQTFRHLSHKHHIPMSLLDVPMDDTPDAVVYLTEQLKECIHALEDCFHVHYHEEILQTVLERENRSRQHYESFLKKIKTKYYPSTLTLQMYMLFATHLNIGETGILHFFEMMDREIDSAPDFNGIQLLWVHLLPYYQETLQSYFNLGKEFQIQACEMNFDYRQPLDITHPLEALARKMIQNVYTRSYNRKVNLVADLAEELDADGVVHFCHWGCKQSSGGVMLLKERLSELEKPLLILDGDAMDRQNSHDGQIKTRWEAFAELLRQTKGKETL